jgi:cytochrome c2
LWSLTTALDRFLAAPGKDVPGTAMPISTPSANDRADLIAYLATATVTAPTPK